ncbi:hypothetical protein MNBD_GAMMA08-1170 [hydrothermal vent metagenome]|uniref:Uncharacterized protein n=1 Tax=hydrothermal vent metagenome TaxID=652676 RepID=A0A3B0YAJ1_9ZZZZ
MFNFENLNEDTRPYVLKAIENAENTNNIYCSARFTERGKEEYLPLLKEAAKDHNEHWLAYSLESPGIMKEHEGASTRSGGYTIKHVPHTAAQTFSEGQFNRFYILGLCLYARNIGVDSLQVYRAKESMSHRAESDSIIGNQILIEDIESQLLETRSSFSSELVKPNSGISVKL